MCSTLIAIGDRVEVKGLGYPNQPKYNRCRGDVIKIEEGCLRIRLLPNYFAGAELLVPPGYLNLVKSEPSPSTASSGTLTTSRPAGSCDLDAWLDWWATYMMKYDPLWMEPCFSDLYLYMHVKLINMLQTISPRKSTSEECTHTTVADWACGAVWGRGGHEQEEPIGPQQASDQWWPAIFVRKKDCARGLTLCYCTDLRAGKADYTRVIEFGTPRVVREKLPQETLLDQVELRRLQPRDPPQAVSSQLGTQPHGPPEAVSVNPPNQPDTQPVAPEIVSQPDGWELV